MPRTPKLRDSGNDLFDRLPADEFDALQPKLQRTRLTLKQVIHQSDADVAHVYFPTTSLISLLTVLRDHDPVEAATVGREGFVGLVASLGITASPYRAICQMTGDSLRLPIRAFLDAMKRGPAMTRLVHRYTAFSLRAAGQSIACNSLHTVEARASRWLLRMHDQARGDEFALTQEFLAFMLGVRRQSVTAVAGTLQKAGLIQFRRGVIVIRDRLGLEEAACECYGTIRGYYEQYVVA